MSEDGQNEASDTIPPETHGWLEQFQALTAESINELEKVCKLGITPAEQLQLFKVAIRILDIAAQNGVDEMTDEQKSELESSLSALTSL